jgi:protoporphyrinogen oxidase
LNEVETLILGGGIAGLACRAGLGQEQEALLLEQGFEVGGLLRTQTRGDFTFENTVHVLFFRDPRIRSFVSEALGGHLREFIKENAVWQKGTTIGYPYQYNSVALPPEIRRECIEGFLTRPQTPVDGATFEAWLLGQFGPGFYRHFFQPFNEKLYGVSLADLRADGMVWTIPADNGESVLRGAEQPTCPVTAKERCQYPKGRRGIGELPIALSRGAGCEIQCGEALVALDPQNRVAEWASGQRLRYRNLVSSLPLPVILRTIRRLPRRVADCLKWLRARPLRVVRVGARRSGPGLPYHWTYFPDPDVPFYRLVRLDRISPDLCPVNGTALLLECAGDTEPDRQSVVQFLHALGVIKEPAVDHYECVSVPFAYVLFDGHRAQAVSTCRAYLEEHGIQSIGRYGQWRYADIEQTIHSGLDAALALSSGGLAGPAAAILKGAA